MNKCCMRGTLNIYSLHPSGLSQPRNCMSSKMIGALRRSDGGSDSLIRAVPRAGVTVRLPGTCSIQVVIVHLSGC